MSQYIEPVKSALVLFPFVALVLTLPYMLFQYRRYGAVLLLRTAIVYSFVLYLMCAYFLVILPLPDVETVSGLTSARVQLIPFRTCCTTPAWTRAGLPRGTAWCGTGISSRSWPMWPCLRRWESTCGIISDAA